MVTAAVTSAPAVATQAHECAFCRANFATDLDLRHHVEIAHTGRVFFRRFAIIIPFNLLRNLFRHSHAKIPMHYLREILYEGFSVKKSH